MKATPTIFRLVLSSILFLGLITSVRAQSFTTTLLSPTHPIVVSNFNASQIFATSPSQGVITIVPWAPINPSNPLPPPPAAPIIPDLRPPSPGSDCVTPPVGLVGWWKGDGDTLDSVSENNGANQNVTYTSGVVGQAFAFDPENFSYGTYTGIQIADQPAYALTNSLTIEGWIRPRGDSYIIFWRGDNRPGLDPYYLSMQDNHTLRFGICDANNNAALVDTTLNYSSWTHVAATLDGGTGTLSIYTNGVLAAQTSSSVRPFGNLEPDQSPGIGIGNLNDGGNSFPFIGDIDEISLYNRALSSTEIAAIYNAGSAGKCPMISSTNDCVTPPADLVSWWKAEGNALDSVGGNNGINQNVTYTTGIDGLAFSFDGSASSYISIPASSNLDIGATGSGITIEGWIIPNYSATEDLPIVEWDSASTDGLQLWAETPYRLYMNVKDTAGNDHALFSANNLINTNTWQHVAGTYDKNTGIAALYINGVAVASTNFGNITPQTTYSLLNIGRRTGQPIGLNQTFHGQLDELSLYNRALSSTEITAIYNAGSAGKCTAEEPSTVPQIFNITPAIATNGARITVSGANFNPNGAGDTVYFGAVQANVLSATATNLVVQVPVGAIYSPITVTVNGLTAFSGQLFEPTFVGDGSDISPASFNSRLDLPAGNGPFKVVIADLDGDGKPDLIVANDYNNTISLYRNISTNGLLTANSFAPRVDLTTPPGQYTPYGLLATDVDGDGKLDIVISDYGSNMVSVYRNTCTPGNISSNTFATRVDFPCGPQPQGIEVKDIDGDGRPEILTANGGDGTVSILRNTSVTGSLTTNSFAPHVDIATGSSCGSIVVGDLDGDGKPDIAAANNTDGAVSVLRNLSSPGNITTNSFAPKVDIAISDYVQQLAIGDLDGDGKLDLTVASYLSQKVSVLRNTSTVGNLSFASPVDFSLSGRGHSPILADLNGDGKPDLTIVTELNSALSIFQNIGESGSFTTDSLAPRIDFGTGWNAWGVAAGDLDGDGRPDLVFCNSYDNTISIYQNQTPLLRNNPPTITSQPLSQTALQGAGVSLFVTAIGSSPLRYQWKFNKSNISKATNATLTLTNLHPAQAGNYTVTVSNPYGTVSSSNATLTVTAQNVLVYNYSGNEKVTTAKQEFAYNYSGQMFLIPGGTNGVFVGWAVISGKRQYWVSAFSDYLWVTIPGSANRTYTVLGKAGNDIDANGQPHIWSYLHKGQNTTLTIGTKKTFSFPSTFACNDSHVYPDPQTGVMILREATSTYTYTTLATQTANNSGETLADLVNSLTQNLAKLGYKSQ